MQNDNLYFGSIDLRFDSNANPIRVPITYDDDLGVGCAIIIIMAVWRNRNNSSSRFLRYRVLGDVFDFKLHIIYAHLFVCVCVRCVSGLYISIHAYVTTIYNAPSSYALL